MANQTKYSFNLLSLNCEYEFFSNPVYFSKQNNFAICNRLWLGSYKMDVSAPLTHSSTTNVFEDKEDTSSPHSTIASVTNSISHCTVPSLFSFVLFFLFLVIFVFSCLFGALRHQFFLRCNVTLLRWLYLRPQYGQGKGRSPVWMSWWRFRRDSVEKPLLQVGHLR